ncbi:MAG: YHS domain-containing protein [Pirellulales bacterium]
MKTRFLLAALVVTALAFSQSLVADDKKDSEKEFSATCPVSGQPAKEDKTVAYKGKKVYFCCENCPKAFEKDPKKFAVKANHQLLATGQMILVACPFTGRDLNPETAVKLGGAEVAFCCMNCKGKFDKAGDDEKLALVFTKIGKGFTLQTECVVSGEPIDVASSVKHDGKKVFFCCDNCPKAFAKDPEKYAAKLPKAEDAE